MDLFVSLLVASTVLLLFFFFSYNNKLHKTISNNRKLLPPGKTGWPIVGETREFVSNALSGHPDRFIRERMDKYSPDIFKTSFAGNTMAVFCGPSGNKFLYSNENKLVVSWWPTSMHKIFGSKTAPMMSMSKKMLQIIPEFIKAEALKKYVPIMDCTTTNQLERSEWNTSRVVKISPLSRNVTFSVSCKLFMGIEDPLLVTKFGNNFQRVMAGLFSVPINLPGTTFNRAIKAANLLKEGLLPIIRQRRNELGDKRNGSSSSSKLDLLSKILTWRDEDGKLLNEMEIGNMILSVLVASHESTSTVITFVVYYLADHPDIYDKVFQEQVEILKSKRGAEELLNWEDIQRMKYSRNVINEVLRLISISQGFRRVVTDFTYQNFFIPKGWKTYWSAHTTHRDPRYFENPDKFDPSRFEGKGPKPYTFVPFGGGPRMCPGAEYARIEVLVFMHRLVTKFKWEKLVPDEKIVYETTPILVNGLPVRLFPH